MKWRDLLGLISLLALVGVVYVSDRNNPGPTGFELSQLIEGCYATVDGITVRVERSDQHHAILMGDHFQLPATVRRSNLGISMLPEESVTFRWYPGQIRAEPAEHGSYIRFNEARTLMMLPQVGSVIETGTIKL